MGFIACRRFPNTNRWRDRLDAFSLVARGVLLHVLTVPDFERASRIGEFYCNSRTRRFAELLIDLEGDRAARAMVVGMLRERRIMDSGKNSSGHEAFASRTTPRDRPGHVPGGDRGVHVN
jgi:hypothetical protein